jgi:hypothetical protein
MNKTMLIAARAEKVLAHGDSGLPRRCAPRNNAETCCALRGVPLTQPSSPLTSPHPSPKGRVQYAPLSTCGEGLGGARVRIQMRRAYPRGKGMDDMPRLQVAMAMSGTAFTVLSPSRERVPRRGERGWAPFGTQRPHTTNGLPRACGPRNDESFAMTAYCFHHCEEREARRGNPYSFHLAPFSFATH